MKYKALIFIFWFCISGLSSQTQENPYQRLDALMDGTADSLTSMHAVAKYVNRNYGTEYEKSRALFYWISQNVSYSPDLMYTFRTGDDWSQLAKDAFDNKVAICTGYAALFDTLCKLCNIPCYIVVGSTRQDFLPAIIGHVWNAVKIYNEWQIVDPTWGTGYLQGNRFVKKINNTYFLADPEKIIKSHLPIDPIWQMLKRPVTLYQFHAQLKSNAYMDWHYADSIEVFLKSDELTQIRSVLRRLKEFGNNSEVTANYTNYLKAKELNYYNSLLNLALKNYNQGVEKYNRYVDFKNHQFSPAKPDEIIRKMIPEVLENLGLAEKQYKLVINEIDDANYKEGINSNLSQLVELMNQARQEKKFVDKYLATPKNKRRDLFYTKIYPGAGSGR
ncbi:MAG: hypothetical protein JNL60_19460 [Bacteroidia bacterium]|nr:hypothetical protein [Bacteroidia bacterium]